mgnify:CR=1 FL=1
MPTSDLFRLSVQNRPVERTLGLPVIDTVTASRTFGDAETAWRDLEARAVTTPYQRFDWVESWYRHIGAASGLEPLIVTAWTKEAQPVFLWPFVVRTAGKRRVAEWPGGKFANYKMGLYDRRVADTLDRDALVPMMAYLRDELGIDALSLTNQPETWRGVANPLIHLPHQRSPSYAYSVVLRPDFEALYGELRSSSTRKKLRRSERRIVSQFGSCTLRRPTSPEDVDRVLGAFFEQKSDRLRQKQLQNVFARPGVMAFLRELATRGIGQDDPLLDLYWLDTGGQVAATWAGTTARGRLSGIINSFDLGAVAQYQPGEVILRMLLEDACDRGLIEFDLGVGEAAYKDSWCPRIDRLFDSFLPLSASGWMHTSVTMTGFRLKRVAKQSKFLRELSERFRQVPARKGR